ncbi:MAG TPA: hypothetical protein VIM62_10220 [Acidobacteriaceae bacterium]
MAWLRQWARALLELAGKTASPAGREWAEGMLRELDFVKSDWAALRWALGGAMVVARRAALDWALGEMDKRRQRREQKMDQMGKKAGWMLAGALGTIALSLAALGLLFAVAVAFPKLGLDHAEWTHVLFVIVLPLAVCLSMAVWLWRRRRPAAIGILVAAVAMSTHVALHFAHHFGGR